jgi:hypothetical protein
MRRVILLLSVVSLLVMTAGCSGGSSTVNSDSSLVTITVGGNGKSAGISIGKNTFFARSGFLAKKFIASAGSVFAAIPAGVNEIDFTITGPEADFQKQSRRVPVVSGQGDITEQFVVSNGNNRHFLVEAKDSSGNVTYTGENSANLDGVPVTINITMSSFLAVTTNSLSAATVGKTYSQVLAARGGTAPYTWSISDGALPAGLSMIAGTGVISGNPATAGTSTFTVQVQDANGATATGNLSITISAPLIVTTALLPGGVVGSLYNQILTATGGLTPYNWSITSGSLPSGLTLNALTGGITGTPATAGTSTFTVQVQDANGVTATNALSIVIATPLSVTTASLPVGSFSGNNNF